MIQPLGGPELNIDCVDSAPVNLRLGPVIQVLFHFDRRHDPISRSNDRLLHVRAKQVTDGKNSGNGSLHVVIYLETPLWSRLQLA